MKLKIPIESQDKMRKIIEIENKLKEVGITFDIGSSSCGREWHLDWSLKGAKLMGSKK